MYPPDMVIQTLLFREISRTFRAVEPYIAVGRPAMSIHVAPSTKYLPTISALKQINR